jgi:hypothetical protein
VELLTKKVMAAEKPSVPFARCVRLRAIVGILAVVLPVLTLAGCGQFKLATEPVEAGEIERIADSIADHWCDPASIRASGNGRLSRSNSTTRFSFAILYDAPSWARMDVHPTATITGPVGNLHFQLDGACPEAYLPDAPLWIEGCLGDEWAGVDEIDMPALMLGFLTPRTVLSIDSPEVGIDKGRTVVRGLVGERTVIFTLTNDLRELKQAQIGDRDGGYVIKINYEGHGWKSEIPVPRTATLIYDSPDTRPEELRLLFTRFRRGPSVDRSAHRMAVPVGLSPVGWDELELWR